MSRSIFRWLAPLLLVGMLVLPATAQPGSPFDAGAENVRVEPVFQYFAAIIYTLTVLIIVCMPSRKS